MFHAAVAAPLMFFPNHVAWRGHEGAKRVAPMMSLRQIRARHA